MDRQTVSRDSRKRGRSVLTVEAWDIPREWPNERCFILCSGESIKAQAETIKRLKGRFIAVRHGVLLRPDADVLFFAGEGTNAINLPLLPLFTGKYVVSRSKMQNLPPYVKCVTRTKDHTTLCDLPGHVSGFDSGTSAINLAYKLGATEIVMCGYDMKGGHFCQHPLPRIPQDHFTRHMTFLPQLNEDAKRKGIRIVNCSPISAVTAFEKQPLEAFL